MSITLKEPFIVPRGWAKRADGKLYQQGQMIPIGTKIIECSSEELEKQIGLKKEAPKKETEK